MGEYCQPVCVVQSYFSEADCESNDLVMMLRIDAGK